MNRDDFIKCIPKPTNQDVILYDISLKDLVDIDVFKEYDKLYPIFSDKKEKYVSLKEKTGEYEKLINSIYLLKPSWNEADYLNALKNDKKTYATLFNEIKRTENNIAILQKNLKGINEKIQIQIAKENKDINEKKDNVRIEIEQNKERLLNLKNYLDIYNLSLKQIKERINDNEEEFEMLCKMESKLQDGKCQCEYCGKMVKTTDENSLFYKRLLNNIEKNKNNLEQLLQEKEKIQTNVNYYRDEIKKLKDILSNDIQFTKENNVFYHKKSIEVLKLEASRDEMLNNISKLQKSLESNSQFKSKQYLELKDRINKYELSLNNLIKVKELKEQSSSDINEYNLLKTELKELLDKINPYLKFIEIYYKIIEQKANDFCGSNFKFKFYKIEDYKLIPTLEIYYKDIHYNQLTSTDREEVDKILSEKFAIYF